MSVCLSPEELFQLTRKKRVPAQIRVLVHLGIDFTRRPDGSLLVYSRDLEPSGAPRHGG